MRASRRPAGAALAVSDDAPGDAEVSEWEGEAFLEEDLSE